MLSSYDSLFAVADGNLRQIAAVGHNNKVAVIAHNPERICGSAACNPNLVRAFDILAYHRISLLADCKRLNPCVNIVFKLGVVSKNGGNALNAVNPSEKVARCNGAVRMKNIKIHINNIVCKLPFERPADGITLAEGEKAFIPVNLKREHIVLFIRIFGRNNNCFAELPVDVLGVVFYNRVNTVYCGKKGVVSKRHLKLFIHKKYPLGLFR